MSAVNTTAAAVDTAVTTTTPEQARSAIERLRRREPIGRIVLDVRPDSQGVDSVPDLPLEDGDRFVVPRVPSSVNVEGQVYNANAFVYRPRRRVIDYLRQAGGPDRQADRRRAFVLRADGSVVSQQYGHGNFEHVQLYPGDTLVVPPAVNRRSILANGGGGSEHCGAAWICGGGDQPVALSDEGGRENVAGGVRDAMARYDEQSINLLDVVVLFVARWRTFLITCGISLVVGMVSIYRIQPLYEANVSILPSSAAEDNNSLSALFTGRHSGDIYVGLLRSRAVVDDVIRRLDLRRVYGTNSQDATRGLLQSKTRIIVGGDSILVLVERDKDAALATRTANAFLDALEDQQIAMATSQSQQRRRFFAKQLEQEKDALANAEDDLRRTQEALGIVQVQQQDVNRDLGDCGYSRADHGVAGASFVAAIERDGAEPRGEDAAKSDCAIAVAGADAVGGHGGRTGGCGDAGGPDAQG